MNGKRHITPTERALAEAIGAAQRELEAAGEPAQFVAGRAPPFVQAAWRRLEEALIALEREVESCPACGRFAPCAECEEVVSKSTRPLPYVQVGMRLVCPADGATWWVVESIRSAGDDMMATLRSCDVRRIEMPCAHLRAEWWLYEDFDPTEHE